jgi:hypothetical protein
MAQDEELSISRSFTTDALHVMDKTCFLISDQNDLAKPLIEFLSPFPSSTSFLLNPELFTRLNPKFRFIQ